MFKICETRCEQCLFGDQRIVTKERMAEIIKDCRKADSHFICHKHNDVMCRGYYETQPVPQMLRIAERLRMVEFVPHKGSNANVTGTPELSVGGSELT